MYFNAFIRKYIFWLPSSQFVLLLDNCNQIIKFPLSFYTFYFVHLKSMILTNRMDKRNMIYTYNGVVITHTFERKEILTHAPIWMSLEDFMFTE